LSANGVWDSEPEKVFLEWKGVKADQSDFRPVGHHGKNVFWKGAGELGVLLFEEVSEASRSVFLRGKPTLEGGGLFWVCHF